MVKVPGQSVLRSPLLADQSAEIELDVFYLLDELER
jgi:hypothetical protein